MTCRRPVHTPGSAAPSAKNLSAVKTKVCDKASHRRLVPAESLRNVHRRSPRLVKAFRNNGLRKAFCVELR